jgi:dihydrodipicolinate synthase/N-acetylneuraminate lyase
MNSDYSLDRERRLAHVRRSHTSDGDALRQGGELDLEAAEAVIERFIEAGVSGISPLGSTGEAAHLTFDERKRFAEEAVRLVAGRVPLVVGVGSSGTREAVEFARHAEGAGADAVLAVSPFYWKVGEEGLFNHFATVGGTVEIPVLLYNIPMLTGIDLSPALISRVAAECENVVGIKDTVVPFPIYYASLPRRLPLPGRRPGCTPGRR